MANKRISELTSITGANLADADLLVVVDVSDTTMASSGTNKKITMSELAKDSALTDNLIAKTTLTTDGDVLTRTSGSPARITRADLAQDSAFSSRYVSKTADDEYRWISAGEMALGLGSPALGTIGGNEYIGGGMLFDASTDEGVTFNFSLPTHWTTYKVEVWWANTASTSGNVRWLFRRRYSGNGEITNGGGTTSAAVDVAAPTTVSEIEVTELATGISNDDAKIAFCVLFRVGSNAADTLANDAGVYGMMLTRLT